MCRIRTYSRNELGSPPTPSRPGPTWVPITGPISPTTRGGTPNNSVPRPPPPPGSRGRPAVLDHPGVGARVGALLEQVHHALEGAARGAHPLAGGDLRFDGE